MSNMSSILKGSPPSLTLPCPRCPVCENMMMPPLHIYQGTAVGPHTLLTTLIIYGTKGSGPPLKTIMGNGFLHDTPTALPSALVDTLCVTIVMANSM